MGHKAEPCTPLPIMKVTIRKLVLVHSGWELAFWEEV